MTMQSPVLRHSAKISQKDGGVAIEYLDEEIGLQGAGAKLLSQAHIANSRIAHRCDNTLSIIGRIIVYDNQLERLVTLIENAGNRSPSARA